MGEHGKVSWVPTSRSRIEKDSKRRLNPSCPENRDLSPEPYIPPRRMAQYLRGERQWCANLKRYNMPLKKDNMYPCEKAYTICPRRKTTCTDVKRHTRYAHETRQQCDNGGKKAIFPWRHDNPNQERHNVSMVETHKNTHSLAQSLTPSIN